MVDQRDTADVSYAQVEARADSEGAPAQVSSALPSSETSLSGLAGENFGILPKPQPHQNQMTREREEDERKEQGSEGRK